MEVCVDRFLSPVLVSPLREEKIFVGGVGDVSHKQQHVLVVLSAPLRIVLGHDRGGVDVISKVEMVIIVKACAKVLPSIGKGGAVRVGVPAATMVILVVVVTSTHHHACRYMTHCKSLYAEQKL